MQIDIVNLIHVDSVWEHVGPKFQRAFEKAGDDLTTGELWQLCRSGNAFLIIAFEGDDILMATVARFERWGEGLVLRVMSLCGERLKEWAGPWEAFMRTMAKDNGAGRIVAEGREWGAVFKDAKKLRSTFTMRV